MHEFSFASHIAEVIMKSVEKNNVDKVLEVTVEIGEFTMIIPQYLSHCYDIVKKNFSPLEDSEMDIVQVPGKVKCLECGEITEITFKKEEKEDTGPSIALSNPGFFTCSKCESTNTRIVGGKEALVKSMKVND
ncbi:MAG: hydrogenase maturation nickel metallochaperone HypA [Candidatus Hodarchaeota archaeon]